MNTFGPIHACLARVGKDFCVSTLASGDVRERVRRALRESGCAHPKRRCPLHPEMVLWLVLGLVLHRRLSIPNVFARVLMEQWPRGPLTALRPVTDGALSHARERLTAAPLRRLFADLALDVEPPATFHGRQVWLIDGARLTLPDTPANVRAFGRPPGSHRSGYPQLHLVTLHALHSRQIGAATWLRVPPSEREALPDLLAHVGPGDLVVLDRGFYAAWVLEAILARGADFVIRVPESVRFEDASPRGLGDFESCVHVPARKRRSPHAQHAATARVRVIVCTVNGKRLRLVTNLFDQDVTPEEIVTLYHERWDVETAFHELKVRLTTVCQGAPPTHLRGRGPLMVEQELWAMLALYNLLRRQMAHAARRADIPPTRLSFVDCLEFAKVTAPQVAQAPLCRLPSLYEEFLDGLAQRRVDRPRRPRRVARVVKSRTKHFPPKKRSHKSRTVPKEPRIQWLRRPNRHR